MTPLLRTLALAPAALLAVLLGLASATSCGGEPRVDAGPDAPLGEDTPIVLDTPSDSPDEDAPVLGPIEFELERGPRFDGCEPWAAVPQQPPRGLPADATPRQLWYWDPLRVDGVFNPSVSDATLGRTGDAYVIFGNEFDQVAGIAPEGSTRFVMPLGTTLQQPIVALPDGTLVVLAASPIHGSAGTIHRFRADGELLGGFRVPVPIRNFNMAVGPEGRLYITSQHSVLALCAEGRSFEVAWHLHITGILPEQGVVDAVVQADGELEFVLGYQVPGGPYLASPPGDVRPLDNLPPHGVSTSIAVRTLGSQALAGVSGDTGAEAVFCRASSTAWRALPDPTGGEQPHYTFDGTGGVVYSNLAGVVAHLGCDDGSVAYQARPGLGFFPLALVDGGGWLSGGAALWRLDSTTGTMLWRVELPAPGVPPRPTADAALSATGLAFASTDVGIYAVQTDALPTTELGCATPWTGCNAARDSSSRAWDR